MERIKSNAAQDNARKEMAGHYVKGFSVERISVKEENGTLVRNLLMNTPWHFDTSPESGKPGPAPVMASAYQYMEPDKVHGRESYDASGKAFIYFTSVGENVFRDEHCIRYLDVSPSAIDDGSIAVRDADGNRVSMEEIYAETRRAASAAATLPWIMSYDDFMLLDKVATDRVNQKYSSGRRMPYADAAAYDRYVFDLREKSHSADGYQVFVNACCYDRSSGALVHDEDKWNGFCQDAANLVVMQAGE